ncbi:MAG: hypothetical protein BZY82_10005 [SAR202 cluster bacterium Io17-Chloro-G3]|nr:MAG: hypothetical protein BZY82_10005 [SAR202 cluster bacterium Io17-Chloro-G3]
MAEHPKALEGVKVAVIGSVVTAPLTARYFSLHGATVVRVDSHLRLDGLRLQRPFSPEMVGNPDGGVWYATVNSTALGLAVDWTKPTGMTIMRRLVKWADVVIENYAPGALARHGLDYNTVSKERPDIVYLSSCIMGQTGPWSKIVGYGQQAAAISGVYDLCGWPDGLPTPIETMYTDFVSPKFGVTAIMAALDYRRRTGKGCYMDQSQVEVGVHMLAPLVMDWSSNGRTAGRSGNRIPESAPHGVYQCAGNDRWVAIGVFSHAQWEGLCDTAGAPVTLREERFETFLGRKKHENALDFLIGEWTKGHSPEDMESLLQAQGVPASVVADARDARENPQLNHRGFFRRFTHNIIGEHTYRGPAFRLLKTPDSQSAGPSMGEHNFEVCTMLGLSDDEIAEAIGEGALGFEPSLP